MKLTFIIILIILSFINCSDDSDILSPNAKMNYRKIAYESLTEGEKESIIIDWRKADVRQGTYQNAGDSGTFFTNFKSKWHFLLYDTTISLYDNYTLIAVTFNTNDDALLGPIAIIIDPTSNKVISHVGRL